MCSTCSRAQGCISCGTCSYPELTEDHVLTSAYVKIFRTDTRNAVNKGVWRKKRLFLTSLKQICNEYLIKFSENQSAPKLENRKTSPCSPCAPNLLHVLMSRTTGYHNLCSPDSHQVNLTPRSEWVSQSLTSIANDRKTSKCLAKWIWFQHLENLGGGQSKQIWGGPV